MTDTSLALPQRLYPLFAPLPFPMILHLVTQEYRRTRRKVASKRPTPEQLWAIVTSRYHILIGQQTIQAALLHEASQMLLAQLALVFPGSI